MKKILYIFIGLSVVMSACETDADIKMPAEDPKLVLTAFLEPGADNQFLKLYMSDPIFDGTITDFTEMIKNADVEISNGITTTKFRYVYAFDAYVVKKDSMLIEYDKEYTITAKYQGKTVVSSIKTISNYAPLLTELKFDSTITDDGFGYTYKNYFGYVTWLDPSAENNYYCIELFGLIKEASGDTTRIALSDFYSNIYISDVGNNGGYINVTIEANMFSPEIFGSTYVGFEMLVTKTDEDYYKYFKSLQNYGGDDPFSEPSLIYSNVNGGLGLVGSYKPYSFKKAF